MCCRSWCWSGANGVATVPSRRNIPGCSSLKCSELDNVALVCYNKNKRTHTDCHKDSASNSLHFGSSKQQEKAYVQRDAGLQKERLLRAPGGFSYGWLALLEIRSDLVSCPGSAIVTPASLRVGRQTIPLRCAMRNSGADVRSFAAKSVMISV
jgi:hypothetical protein